MLRPQSLRHTPGVSRSSCALSKITLMSRLRMPQPIDDAAVAPGSYAPDVHRFEAELWLWKDDAAWHFVSLPDSVADEIDEQAGPRRGFGSVPVQVTIGSSTWSTSVFPDSKRATYLLPVKKQVRNREGVGAGDVVTVQLSVRQSA